MSRYQLLPALTDDERASLTADIQERGVLVPIVIDEMGEIIDGHHRKEIADSHGLPCPAIKCPPNLTDVEKRSLAVDLNVHRRHLTREQKRQAIADSLQADPELSDRQHAERFNASPSTVGSVRSELEDSGTVSKLDTRVGKDGVTQPTRVTPDRAAATQATPAEAPADDRAPEGAPVLPVPASTPEPSGAEPDKPVTGLDGKQYPRNTERDEAREIVTAIADAQYTDADRWSDDFLKAMSAARRGLLLGHTDEQLADALSDEDVTDIERLAESIAARAVAIRTIRKAQQPTGLRVLQGGN